MVQATQARRGYGRRKGKAGVRVVTVGPFASQKAAEFASQLAQELGISVTEFLSKAQQSEVQPGGKKGWRARDLKRAASILQSAVPSEIPAAEAPVVEAPPKEAPPPLRVEEEPPPLEVRQPRQPLRWPRLPRRFALGTLVAVAVMVVLAAILVPLLLLTRGEGEEAQPGLVAATIAAQTEQPGITTPTQPRQPVALASEVEQLRAQVTDLEAQVVSLQEENTQLRAELESLQPEQQATATVAEVEPGDTLWDLWIQVKGVAPTWGEIQQYADTYDLPWWIDGDQLIVIIQPGQQLPL